MKNSRATSCLSTISRPPDSKTRSRVIREWLVRFGVEWNEPIDARIPLWEDELADLPPDAIERACRAALRMHRFGFPKISDIRAQIDAANASGFELQAERAWQRALEHANRWYYPDWGLDRNAPSVAPAVEFGVAAAGGWRRLAMCSEDDLVWCRKAFLERYATIHETRQVEHLLTRGGARRILAELTAGPRAVAPQALAPAHNEPDEKPSRDEVRAVLDGVVRPRTQPPPPSAGELGQRAAEQKRCQQEWLAKRSRKIESVDRG